MQKLLFYFIALFVLFFACTQNQSETPSTEQEKTTVNNTDVQKDIPVATPIPPPEVPTSNIKPVAQAPKKDLVYPKDYVDLGVQQFKGAEMQNNLMLDNSQGKYGRRIKMKCSASYDQVFDFYKNSLEKNGWTKNAKMDKTLEDEDVKFFSTNYVKERYTLMLSLTDLGNNNISVMQILKEN